jgi:hypothetical protein
LRRRGIARRLPRAGGKRQRGTKQNQKAAQPHANPDLEKLSRINILMVNEGLEWR